MPPARYWPCLTGLRPATFADVYQLGKTFQPTLLVERAASLDLGFTPELLAQAITTLSRFRDTDIPIAEAELPLLKAFFVTWTETLKSS